MGAHSILSPSSAGRWGSPTGCQASVMMAQAYPQSSESSEAAQDGTIAHAIGEHLLRVSFQSLGRMLGYKPARDMSRDALVGTIFEVISDTGAVEAARAVTHEMYDAAEMYARVCASQCHRSNVFDEPYVGVEVSVAATAINELCHGTPDFYLYDPKTNTLHVYDLKYGYGVVEAEENRQLLIYASAIADLLCVEPNIELTIVQPRAWHRNGPVRSWYLTHQDHRIYIEQLRMMSDVALSASPTYRSGRHCRYCSGRYACDVALLAGLDMYEAVSDGGLPANLEDVSIAVQLQILQRATDQLGWIRSGLEEEVKARISKGRHVPNYAMVSKKTPKKWTKPEEEVRALGSLFNVTTVKETILTPTQLTKAGIPEEVIDRYSERSTTTSLTFDNGSRAAAVFSNK